jgi:DNA-binding NarL/FixJ family response regulator
MERRPWLRGGLEGEPLSFSEWGVLMCMALGYRDKDIARELSRSIFTVKTHSMYIYQKFGAKNRAEAVATGFREGYLA